MTKTRRKRKQRTDDTCFTDDGNLLCKRCGAITVIKLPMSLADFPKLLLAFVALHSFCPPMEATNEDNDDGVHSGNERPD